MKLVRPISAAAVAALLGLGAVGAPAGADGHGAGSARSSTTALAAQLGENGALLDLALVEDEADATTDPAVSPASASSRLTAARIKSAAVAALDVRVPSTPWEARSTGPTSYEVAARALAPDAVAPVVTGSVKPGKLVAEVVDGVATAGIASELAGVKAVGGLVGIESVGSTVTAAAGGANAAGTRRVAVEQVTALDLGELLAGLGIPLTDLSVSQVVTLVDALGAATGLPLPSGQQTLAGAIAALEAAIDELQATVDEETSTVVDVVDASTSQLLTAIGLQDTLPDVGESGDAVVSTVNAAVDLVQDELDKLLVAGLAALDAAPLLSFEGVEVAVATKAAQSVEASLAEVTGRIGKVRVGALALPGVDLAAAASKVNALVSDVESRLSAVLSVVDPRLAGIVDVRVLEQTTEVSRTDGYTRATAGVTAAGVDLTPPATLGAVVAAIRVQADQIGDVLPASAISALGLDSVMATLGDTLGATLGALSAPASLELGRVVSASDFTAGSPVDAPGGTLPRTGSAVPFAIAAAAAAALAVAVRRVVSASATGSRSGD